MLSLQKKKHLKTKRFKWLVINESKKFTEKQKAKKTNRITFDIKSINPKAEKKGRKKSDKSTSDARKAMKEDDFDTDEAFIIIETLINFAREWIMDSEISRHMTSNESIFLNQRRISTIIKIVNERMLKTR